MKSLLLTASVLAAVAMSVPAVRAADLDYDRSPADRYSAPYDDPRYRDLYGAEPRHAEHYQYQERTYRDAAPPLPQYGYRDDYVAPQRFAEGYSRPGCLPRHEIRYRLGHDGWYGLRPLALQSDVALLRASRSNGLEYELRVDRCTGSVVDARPIGGYVPGPYAYGPRRWERPYF